MKTIPLFLLLTFTFALADSHADTQNLANADACFIVYGDRKIAPGRLCIDGLEQFAGDIKVGAKFEARFYTTNDRPAFQIPLELKFIDSFNIGRFATLTTFVIEGEADGYSVSIHFSDSLNERGLPHHHQKSGYVSGPGGSQTIQRYIWERDQFPPPPPQCNRPHCH